MEWACRKCGLMCEASALRAWLAERRAYDLVFAITDTTGLAATLAVTRLRPRPTLLYYTMGLCHRLHHGRSRLIRSLVARAVRRHSTLLTESRGEAAAWERLGVRTTFLPFGIDVRFWDPTVPIDEKALAVVRPIVGGGDYYMAIGNDYHRDFQTLVAAAGATPRRIVVVSSRRPPTSLPYNVQWCDGDLHRRVFSDQSIRELYRNARAVLVPLKQTLQSSGHSVTLQAMSMGKPVAITRVDGFWSPDQFLDGVHLRLMQVGDIAGWQRLLCEWDSCASGMDLLGTAARELVSEKCTSQVMAEQVVRLISSKLQDRDTHQSCG